MTEYNIYPDEVIEIPDETIAVIERSINGATFLVSALNLEPFRPVLAQQSRKLVELLRGGAFLPFNQNQFIKPSLISDVIPMRGRTRIIIEGIRTRFDLYPHTDDETAEERFNIFQEACVEMGVSIG